MHELKKIFNEKRTENGDKAYYSVGNKYLDILFKTQFYRNNLNQVPVIGTSNYDKLFACFIRDCRFGVGERDLGRILMKQSNVDAENILMAGRADDLLFMDKLEDFIELLYTDNYYAKKWSPRLTSGYKSKILAKKLIKMMNITEREYRKLIKCDTIENSLSNDLEVVDFSHIPSLAFIKHFSTLNHKYGEKFQQFLDDVKNGKAKINVATSTPYDVVKAYHDKKIDNKTAETMFNSLKNKELSLKILPIVDNSGSMIMDNAYLKARAIGYYISQHSTYLPNHVVTFSAKPKLIELTGNFTEDMKIMNSWSDMTNTDFGKVMKLLGELKEDFPDYLLVLSDMEFDCGSSLSKKSVMNSFKKHNIPTRIIWWNFNSRNETCPEMDNDGNIFISGYNPNLLKFLESGFDAKKFLDKLLKEYSEKIINN